MNSAKLNFEKFLVGGVLGLLLLVSFLGGMWVVTNTSNPKLRNLLSEKKTVEEQLTEQIDQLSQTFSDLEQSQTEKTDYQSQVTDLQGKVAGLTTELQTLRVTNNSEYPFAVPTTGEVVTFAGTYAGNMQGIQHFGIDIWTSRNNNGQQADNKGNAVYAACSGRVVSLDRANGAVEILCDEISRNFNLPAYKNLVTYYGHLGNPETGEQFITVSQGQRVSKGQKIGYQGCISKFFPEMRNIHLHFQIYAGKATYPWNKTGGPYNPCLYIGGDCSRPGVKFQATEN